MMEPPQSNQPHVPFSADSVNGQVIDEETKAAINRGICAMTNNAVSVEQIHHYVLMYVAECQECKTPHILNTASNVDNADEAVSILTIGVRMWRRNSTELDLLLGEHVPKEPEIGGYLLCQLPIWQLSCNSSS